MKSIFRQVLLVGVALAGFLLAIMSSRKQGKAEATLEGRVAGEKLVFRIRDRVRHAKSVVKMSRERGTQLDLLDAMAASSERRRARKDRRARR